jgi:hypothetical protein
VGRIKEYDRKAGRRRKRKPVVYIICEGTETEPRYFNAFRTRYCNIDIVPLPSSYKSADSLVRKTKSTLGERPYYPDEGDVVWCVFDRDDNTDEMLRKAGELAGRDGYRIAFSNPCFEYWYLLHFTDHFGYLEDSDAVIRQLRKKDRIPDYIKAKDHYSRLLPMQEDAIRRAKKRKDAVVTEHEPLLRRDNNPVTNVYELVEFLNSRRK